MSRRSTSRGWNGSSARHVTGEVRFDAGSLAMYANDSSNFRQVPVGVVAPRTYDDVVATVRACRRYRAPVLPRGGGTSLSGETVNNAVIGGNIGNNSCGIQADGALSRRRGPARWGLPSSVGQAFWGVARSLLFQS